MKGSKILATLIVLAMLLSTIVVLNTIIEVKAYPPATTPGVDDFGNATTDLYYDPDNGKSITINTTGMKANKDYYLYKPIYNCSGTALAAKFDWDDSPVQTTSGPLATFKTDADPTNKFKSLGSVILDKAGMWILDDDASWSGNDITTFGSFFWVNTSTKYTITSISDFYYGSNTTKTFTVKEGANAVSCYVDLVGPDGNTIFHQWTTTPGSYSFKTWGNITMAGNYTARAYRDFDLDATSGNVMYEYRDETTAGVSTGFYTSYGSNFSGPLNNTLNTTGSKWKFNICGPWDPPEKNASEMTFTVMPGTPSLSIKSPANEIVYWGFSGSLKVEVKDSSGGLIPKGDYNVVIFNRAGKDVTANLSKAKSNEYCWINSTSWGKDSSVYGANGTWTVYIWVDKNGDRTDATKEWNEEWNGSIKFKVQRAPGVQFKWIDDDGTYFTGADDDGVIPSIAPIAVMDGTQNVLKFQIIGDDHTYYGDGGAGFVTRAKENITLSGNALFTGTLDTIPGVTYSSSNWSVPVIPTMSQGGGTITIAGSWKTTAKTYGSFSEKLDIGGTLFKTNGTEVIVTPSEFEIGTDQTFSVQVKSADNVPYPWATVRLYYTDDTDGVTPGTPITTHLVDDQIGGTNGIYTLKLNTTQQQENQTAGAGFPNVRAPRNFTIYVIATNAGNGYARIQMKPKSNLKVEVFPETMLAGYEYGTFYINTTVVTTGNTTEKPYKDDYDELTIQILDENGDEVTDSIDASFTYAQINNDNEIGQDYVVDMPNAYIKKAGIYTIHVFNYTSNSDGNNATLVVKQAKVTVDKTPLIWTSDNNISVTFTVTDEVTGELLNGTLRIDNMTWDVDYNKTWTNCSFDGSADQGGNQSIDLGESEGFVNGRITIHDITANFLDPKKAYQNITFWFQPELSDGGLGEYARAKGVLPVSVPTVTTDKNYVSVGRTTSIIATTTGRGVTIPNIYVRLHGQGIDTNGTSDAEGKVVFSILPTSTGNISIDVGEEGRKIDTVIVVTSWLLDTSASPTDVEEGEDFTVTVMKDGTTTYIEGADVTFNSVTKQTDENGQVTFTAPAVTSDRTYTIKVAKTGYAPDPDGLSITVINVPKLTIVIPSGKVYSGSTFQLTVADDTGQAVIGATVTFNGATYSTAAGGTATLTAPDVTEDSKSYTITATFPGFGDAGTATIIIYKQGIPGFELITLIIAIGVAFILLRRRRH